MLIINVHAFSFHSSLSFVYLNAGLKYIDKTDSLFQELINGVLILTVSLSLFWFFSNDDFSITDVWILKKIDLEHFNIVVL